MLLRMVALVLCIPLFFPISVNFLDFEHPPNIPYILLLKIRHNNIA